MRWEWCVLVGRKFILWMNLRAHHPLEREPDWSLRHTAGAFIGEFEGILSGDVGVGGEDLLNDAVSLGSPFDDSALFRGEFLELHGGFLG